MDALAVVHEDDALLVLDKPAGLLSVRGRGAAGDDCLAVRVQARYRDALVVHRLDMATSGLMLFARGAEMQRCLSRAFEDRRIVKRYIAIVEGRLPTDAGEIAQPLAADWPERPRQRVDPERGKPALTRWRVLERADAWTRLELTPVSGRSHQLRVHLQWLGHPIRGDALYGLAPPTADRLLLHAAELSFMHPSTQLPVAYASLPCF
jgi:tRNA pseudouridine32 synthase/23S rRNA pseudouridine746 synthase